MLGLTLGWRVNDSEGKELGLSDGNTDGMKLGFKLGKWLGSNDGK